MTITASAIYFISLIDNIQTLCGLSCIVAGIILGARVIWRAAEKSLGDGVSNEPLFKRNNKIIGVVSIVTCIFATFMPSDKTIIAMYTIPSIVNNQQVQQLPANLLNFVNDYLKKKEDKK